jgi:hypothetical protein
MLAKKAKNIQVHFFNFMRDLYAEEFDGKSRNLSPNNHMITSLPAESAGYH